MGRRDSWKSIEIGQSAAKLRIGERSETSPRGRTPRNRGKREAYGFIYLLIDPYSTEVKYIGKTSRNVFVRLAEHFRLEDKTPNKELQLWLRQIDCEPTLKFKKYPLYLLNKAEKYWINFYKDDNNIFNYQTFNPVKYQPARKIGQFKKILRVNPNTGETKEYASITHAALVNNVHIGNISRCANGTRSTTGGFV